MGIFWNLPYSDMLLEELNRLPSGKQREYFLSVYHRMGKYILEHEEEYTLTFKEYFDMFER